MPQRSGREGTRDGRWPPRLTAILLEAAANILHTSMRRHVLLVLLAGAVGAANGGEMQVLWTFYGMLIGAAISLLMDEEADGDLSGPLDRIDHAAVAGLGAQTLHLVAPLAA